MGWCSLQDDRLTGRRRPLRLKLKKLKRGPSRKPIMNLLDWLRDLLPGKPGVI